MNADDLGLSTGVDRAIFEGHDRGIVTSASLMATGPAFEHAVAGLSSRPRLGCGIHLVLHEEKPALDPARIPSLVGADGRLKPLREAVRGLLFGTSAPAEIEAEYAAQIQRALDRGIRPSHLDSHCHLHAFPAVGPIVHALGERFGIACARQPEAGSWSDYRAAPLARYPLAFLITASQRFTRRRVAVGLRSPDKFLGLVHSGALDVDWMVRAIDELEPGVVAEIMVHPGDGTGEGEAGGDHGPYRRRVELEAVTSPRVLEAIRRRGVELIDYRALVG
ncbi:MAG: ChbG/HpnK family deacetylase [Planctomycetota bacterium]|nr:ChbG/HpnK family deacetylase [Planctomycetota bacterium]